MKSILWSPYALYKHIWKYLKYFRVTFEDFENKHWHGILVCSQGLALYVYKDALNGSKWFEMIPPVSVWTSFYCTAPTRMQRIRKYAVKQTFELVCTRSTCKIRIQYYSNDSDSLICSSSKYRWHALHSRNFWVRISRRFSSDENSNPWRLDQIGKKLWKSQNFIPRLPSTTFSSSKFGNYSKLQNQMRSNLLFSLIEKVFTAKLNAR